MIITHESVNEVSISSPGVVDEFKIRNSAKAFSILSSGLYANKIKAIIRELSCNAVDSHIAAGKADVPFEVHLPSALEPWFAVRDFGTGLDHEQVSSIYTTYFESTKVNSNDFIGALGLGSKSPFSYTENFTITAIKDGVSRIYSAFINERGVPSVVLMSEDATEEENGVEVKFSVVNSHDTNRFKDEAQSVFAWFKHRPRIVGIKDFEIGDPPYRSKDIIPGVHEISGYKSYAVMGNICYPLSNVPDASTHFGHLARYLDCNIVIEFDIGELDFAASREELSYIPMTYASIKRKLIQLDSLLYDKVKEELDAIENVWVRADKLKGLFGSRLYAQSASTYVTSTGFKLIDNRGFTLTAEDLEKENISIESFSFTSMTSDTIRMLNFVRDTKGVSTMRFDADPGYKFVLNDLKSGCRARARYHYSQGGRSRVFCITYTGEDDDQFTKRTAAFEKFIASIDNPPNVVYASTLSKKPSDGTGALNKQGIMHLVKKQSYYSYTDDYVWKSSNDITFLDTSTYYYVEMSGFVIKDTSGAVVDIRALRALMAKTKVDQLAKIAVFGVRQSMIADIKARKNWVNLFDYLKTYASTLPPSVLQSYAASSIFDNYHDRKLFISSASTELADDSVYLQFSKKYKNYYAAKTNTVDVSTLVSLLTQFGMSTNMSLITQSIINERQKVLDKYPLLKHIGSATDSEVIAYVKLVDCQDSPC